MKHAAIKPELGRCLEAVVELTRYHDPQELAAALLRTLRDQLDAQRVRLLAIASESHAAEFNAANVPKAIVYDLLDAASDEPLVLAADPELLACVRSRAPVHGTAAGRRRLILPVFGARDVWALVVVENPGVEAVAYDLLARLLRVYSNQTFLLSCGQLDPLTGLYNRQSFYDRIKRVARRTAQQRRASDGVATNGNCFALFDIDNFKAVNDRFGHLYGDEVLLLLARLTTRSFRHDDLLFRYGGEEFAVVLVNADLDGAERLLERFRAAVEEYEFPRLEPKTVSIGLTALNIAIGVDRVVMRADSALYYAKNNGRNRVCCYERLVAEGKLDPVTVAEGDIELF